MEEEFLCTAEQGCPRPAKRRSPGTPRQQPPNWCGTHYMRYRRTGSPHIVRRIFGDDRARFESYIVRAAPDACHPWRGSLASDGYGHIRMGDQIKLSHVVAWEFEHEQPRPPGAEIDHECHNRAVREG